MCSVRLKVRGQGNHWCPVLSKSSDEEDDHRKLKAGYNEILINSERWQWTDTPRTPGEDLLTEMKTSQDNTFTTRGRLLCNIFLPLISSELSRFSFCLMQTAGVDGKKVLLKTQEDGKRMLWCINLLPGTGQSWLLPPGQGDVGVCLPFWVFSTSAPNLKLSVETKNKMLNKGGLPCEWSPRYNFKWKF